jgi:hypothetical protein
MRAARPQDALERLTTAIRDVESELAAVKAEHDPLASHIFVSRRHHRNVNDTKSGKRREMMARLSFNTASELESWLLIAGDYPTSDISRMGFCKFCITQEQLEQMRQLSETPEAIGRVPVNG